MKKNVFALAVCGVLVFALAVCAGASPAPDYSQPSSWCRFPEITKDVDTFYICATEYIMGSFEDGAPDYATLDNEEMLKGFEVEYMTQASVYADSTNVFVPYYRQSGLRYAGEAWKKTGSLDAALLGMPYEDITTALDYYFEHCNNGRPFIIAGHSQGSAITLRLLKKYFREHPDYYERMVAAYVIGYSVTKDDLAANPHLKFASGESDTGVIVSWNTEGKQNVETNAANVVVLPGTISINPLNWKLDETYAPVSENLGSLIEDKETGEPSIGDAGADAQVNLARGVVVTNAKAGPIPDFAAKIVYDFFGPDARHDNDYTFYYNNIKDNVAKRIAAYKAGTVKAPDYSKFASWYKIPPITKDVDTFFVYPTDYMAANEGDPDYAPLDNPEMLEGVKFDHMIMASAYEESTNLFIPYYRQAGMRYAGEIGKKSGDPRKAFSATPYEDITAALDYYFENYNNGRPFIIAGHSQGSGIITLVLKDYFKEHPEYYKRMIAAYVIGFSVTKDDLAANPHLKFATGESDTGVIVSWNTEGLKNVEWNVSNVVVLPGEISINPLNWKLDDTYAPASENKGSLVLNENTGTYEIGDIGADAQVVLNRGVILTHADSEPVWGAEFFGPQSFHNGDYTFYYNNIKDNAAKRISAYKANAGKAPDYSQPASWYKIPEITKDVDTFYINSTAYIVSSFEDGAPDYAAIDNKEMLAGFEEEYMSHATVYEDSTNVFMPYYRQSGLRYAGEVQKKTGNIDAALLGVPYEDITAALDYYFEKYNGGRPFILAGHSQGSAIAKLVLEKYFKEHPDYYKRMIAAYVIGFSVTKDDLEACPHLKFAKGENDTGVIISWNTEGRKNLEMNATNSVVLPNAISINPLNWKLDETYAPASENLGSLFANEETGEPEIGDIGADAQINLARGVVITNVKARPLPEEVANLFAALFGPDGRHDNDYTYYYSNIKDNVAKRIAAYMTGR
ncbi:MAG: DUF3089 domain-containing protein [Synergistaceae bacterium]|nr:DUF3089 domain-containing protein [Synergistaceae bacterium]